MDVGLACSKSDSTLELAAKHGFYPLLSWHQKPEELGRMIATYVESPALATKPDRSRVRVSRMIYVANSAKQARTELRDCDIGAAKFNRLNEYIPEGGTRDDLTMEHMMDEGVLFCGDPDTVTNMIRRFYDELGGFGTLLLVCGKDWGTWEQRQRSWRMFNSEVAPRLADLDGNTKAF